MSSPRLRRFTLLVIVALSPALAVRADFVRGDVDRNGRLALTDAIVALNALFAGASAFECDDAADVNDDGRIDIADPIALLRHLFLLGAIPAPGPAAGPDPTCDRLRCRDAPDPTPAVVINEILYHASLSANVEFIELHNRSAHSVSLDGYRFTDGVEFEFPEDATIDGGGFVVVALSPRNLRGVDALGPYEGELSNGGERITLTEPGGCRFESFEYDDGAPWPRSADGYGRSLERIDVLAPADDVHSWRASIEQSGTPGERNSTAGAPTHPLLGGRLIAPFRPRHDESVDVWLEFDVPPDALGGVTLESQSYTRFSTGEVVEVDMEFVRARGGRSTYRATLPPRPVETLVRFRARVELASGDVVALPAETDVPPYLSYFVQDPTIESRLTLLRVFKDRRVDFLGRVRQHSAVIFLAPLDGTDPAPVTQLYDGVDVFDSENGQKIRFLRGEEHGGDRTLNILPEDGGGGSGTMAPFMEHLGFLVFRELGALAPRADWHRVLQYDAGRMSHTQNLLVQQVNERFLGMNGLDESADLYKLDKNRFEKKTNPETGTRRLSELRARINSANEEVRAEALRTMLDLESVQLYSTVSVLIANWDGFHNNMYLYDDLSPDGDWKLIPWDLDQVFQTSAFDFPLSYPLDGRALPGASFQAAREPGAISRPFHRDARLDAGYRDSLRAFIQPDAAFSETAMEARIAPIEERLLADLELQEALLGGPRAARRAAIRGAYASIRQYMTRRLEYLRQELEAPE